MRFAFYGQVFSLALCLFSGNVFAAPTDLDTSYGVSGRATVEVSETGYIRTRMARQADGKVLIAGTVVTGAADRPPTRIFVRRFNADGSTDASYGTNGEFGFSVRGADTVTAIAIQADGKAVLAVDAVQPCTVASLNCISANGEVAVPAAAVARLTTNGVLDAAFGDGGVAMDTSFYGPRAIVVQADGKILLLGTNSVARASIYNWRLARFNSDGSPDTSFNNGTPASSLCPVYGLAMHVRDDGAIVVAGDTEQFFSNPSDSRGICVEGRRSDGSPDPDLAPSWISWNANLALKDLQATQDGRLVLTGSATIFDKQNERYRTGIFLSYLTKNGSIPAPGGSGGGFIFPINVDTFIYGGTMLEPYGSAVTVGTQQVVAQGGSTQIMPVWERTTPSGMPDFSFGSMGTAIGPADGNTIDDAIRQPDGKWLLAFHGPQRYGIARYLGTSVASVPALEFFNTGLKHYFVTASPGEIAGIDAGAAGPGWTRTGKAFRVFIPEQGIAAEAAPACRFYGTPGVGPNSHFYTVDTSECEQVKRDPGWLYEGTAFHAFLKQSGPCMSGTEPVYRAYNNRASQNDSNHRYATDRSVLEAMQGQGWTVEGIAFCAPLN